jgi:hypothetical protein
MDGRRTLVVVALVAFGLLVAVWGTRSWSDTKPLAPPPGVKQQVPDTVRFECGAPFGSASVHGPASTPRPVVGTPCGHRDERRRLAFVEIVAAAIAIGYVMLGRRPHEPTPVDPVNA